MEQLEAWTDFNVAMAGATAALAGLVIVAASVNIRDIVTSRSLTARLAAGIAGLVLALSGSAIGLIPALPPTVYGAALIVCALLAGAFSVEATRQVFADPVPQSRFRALKSALSFAAPTTYLLGGLLLVAGAPTGLLWFAAGSIVAIVTALIVSWIVLVEVLR
jgi:hypothetical protein